MNGTFEAGNTGFTSSYPYVTPVATNCYPEPTYTVTTNPNNCKGGAFPWLDLADHTSGSGQMFVANGSPNTTAIVWQGTVNQDLVIGNSYDFSAWLIDVFSPGADPAPPTLTFKADGVTIGTYSSGAHTWTRLFGTFVATSKRPVLTLTNAQSAAFGNDFGIDDINIFTAGTTTPPPAGPVATTITWANPADITYPTPLSATQLNAVYSVPGTCVYTPAAGTVLNAGAAQTLSVTCTPTDTVAYLPATTTVKINVLKATPTVTWVTPTPIRCGSALSATQLNATASVPGTFVYTPPAGTLLAAGSQTLSTTFTPTDTTNYNTVTTTVTQSVLPFVNPNTGGPWNGTFSGINLIYNGLPYAIANGRVAFPDCTTWVVAPTGYLSGPTNTPNCTPFCLVGTVPTMSDYGLIALAFALMMVSVLALRRARRRTA